MVELYVDLHQYYAGLIFFINIKDQFKKFSWYTSQPGLHLNHVFFKINHLIWRDVNYLQNTHLAVVNQYASHTSEINFHRALVQICQHLKVKYKWIQLKANHRGPHLANNYVLNFMCMNINNEVNWIIYVKLSTYAKAYLCHFLLTKDMKMNTNKLCRGVLQRCLYVGRWLIFKVCGVKVFVSVKCKHVRKTWQNQPMCLSRCIYSIKPHWFTQNKVII